MEERCSGVATDHRAEMAAKTVLDAAFRVHSELGPGLLESVYERCLAWELESVGVPFEQQLVLPVRYRNLDLDAGLRLDLLVDDCLIVEIKAVDSLTNVHRAQVLTYLKLARKRLGLLLNFNVTHLRQGIRRVVL